MLLAVLVQTPTMPWCNAPALQARLGQQLWPREQPSLAHPLVPSAAAVALFVQTGEPGVHVSCCTGVCLRVA